MHTKKIYTKYKFDSTNRRRNIAKRKAAIIIIRHVDTRNL